MALIPCSQCGHMISDKAYNCPKCGKSINASTQPTTSGNNSDNKGYKTAILVTIIVILAIALIVVLVIAFNKNKHDDKDYHKSDKSNPVEEEVVEEPVTLYDDYQDDYDNSISLSELNSIIREYNDELPEYIDEGMDLETVYLDGDYVVYSYSLDEDYYDIDYFRTNRSDVKRSLKNDVLNNTDESVRIFIDICKDNNKGIAYRFVGLLSGDACTIYIQPDEL